MLRIGGAALSPGGTFEQRRPADRRRSTDPVLREALLVGVLCSDAELEAGPIGELVIDGSATEGALQVAAVKAGLDRPSCASATRASTCATARTAAATW